MHPDDRPALLESAQRLVAARVPFTHEFRMRRHDGVYVAMAMRCAPVFNADGTVREWIGANTDISARKAAEERRDFMANASTALASSLDHRVTFERVAELAVPALADLCSVDILDDDQHTWHAVAVAHAPAGDAARAKAGAMGPKRNRSLAQALRSGKP